MSFEVKLNDCEKRRLGFNVIGNQEEILNIVKSIASGCAECKKFNSCSPEINATPINFPLVHPDATSKYKIEINGDFAGTEDCNVELNSDFNIIQ